MKSKYLKPRARIHKRIRRKVFGTNKKPRLSLHRSPVHMRAQLIDDMNGKTILFVSTTDSDFRKKQPYGGNIKAAELLGEILAQKAKVSGITSVVFDRGGFLYHGRVKSLAEAARKGGLKF